MGSGSSKPPPESTQSAPPTARTTPNPPRQRNKQFQEVQIGQAGTSQSRQKPSSRSHGGTPNPHQSTTNHVRTPRDREVGASGQTSQRQGGQRGKVNFDWSKKRKIHSYIQIVQKRTTVSKTLSYHSKCKVFLCISLLFFNFFFFRREVLCDLFISVDVEALVSVDVEALPKRVYSIRKEFFFPEEQTQSSR